MNQGWHSYKISNKFLDVENKYLEMHYKKQKNILQERLIDEYSEMIEILPIDNTGNPSIVIKDKYQFESYKDACHTKEEEK